MAKSPKKVAKKIKQTMKEVSKERYPGVNGELFQIRVVDTGNFIVCEIKLIYTDNGQEKLASLRNDEYKSGTNVKEIIEKTKATIQAITIIAKEAEDAKITQAIDDPITDVQKVLKKKKDEKKKK